MRRKLTMLAAAASLACFLGTVGLWALCRAAAPAGTGTGVAVGWRLFHDSSHPICGIYLREGDGSFEQVWYVRRCVPLRDDRCAG